MSLISQNENGMMHSWKIQKKSYFWLNKVCWHLKVSDPSIGELQKWHGCVRVCVSVCGFNNLPPWPARPCRGRWAASVQKVWGQQCFHRRVLEPASMLSSSKGSSTDGTHTHTHTPEKGIMHLPDTLGGHKSSSITHHSKVTFSHYYSV